MVEYTSRHTFNTDMEIMMAVLDNPGPRAWAPVLQPRWMLSAMQRNTAELDLLIARIVKTFAHTTIVSDHR